MLKVVAEVTEMLRTDIKLGIDGCGVPVFGLPIYNMALAYARLSRPEGLAGKACVKALRRICSAMIVHPFYVAGTNRLDTILMEVTSGLKKWFEKVKERDFFGSSQMTPTSELLGKCQERLDEFGSYVFASEDFMEEAADVPDY